MEPEFNTMNSTTEYVDIMNSATEYADIMNSTTEYADTLNQLNSNEVRNLAPAVLYLVLLVITGGIGNLLVLCVYCRYYRQSNIKTFILCLCCTDLFSCCVVIPLEITVMTMPYTFHYCWLCKLSRFLNACITLTSAVVLLIIAIDRYRKMCKPFRWQIGLRHARYLCGVCYIIGLLPSWPGVIIYGCKTPQIPEHYIEGTKCSIDNPMKDTIYPLLNGFVLLVIFMVGMASVCVLYCLIGFEIHKHISRMPKEFIIVSKRSLKQMDSAMSSTYTSETITCSVPDSNNGISGTTDASKCISFNNNPQTVPVVAKHVDNDEDLVNENSETATYMSDTTTNSKSDSNDNGNPGTTVTSKRIRFKRNNSQTMSVDAMHVDKDTEVVNEKGGNDGNSSFEGSCHENKCLKTTPKDKENNADTNDVVKTNISPTSSVLSNSSRNSPKRQQLQIQKSRSFTVDQQSNATRKTSILMLIISCTYIISFVPHLSLMVIREMQSDFEENMSASTKKAYNIFLRSYFINFAANPVIYCLYGSNFRSECKRLFRSLITRKRNR